MSFPLLPSRLCHNHLTRPTESQSCRIQHHVVERGILPRPPVVSLHVAVPVPVGFVEHLLDVLARDAEMLDGHLHAPRFGAHEIDVKRVRPPGEDSLRSAPDEHRAPVRRRLGDDPLRDLHDGRLFGLRLRQRGGPGPRARRDLGGRRREVAGDPGQEPRRPLLLLRHLVRRQSRPPGDLVDELVVDHRPPELRRHVLRDFGAAGGVLPGDRDERRILAQCRPRFFLRSPRLSTGSPPSVGTMMMRLSEPFMSRRTSRYCLVSASGVSVTLSSRTCSACRRATSTRWRSVSTCCSCAILALMAWTTACGGWRSRRKNAVTVAMRNGPLPERGCVISAESTSASMVCAIWVRLAMSLIEYWTIPSRTPFRIAFRTAPWIWRSSPISV